MAEKKSNLAEAVEETAAVEATETKESSDKDEFNPLAFSEVLPLGEVPEEKRKELEADNEEEAEEEKSSDDNTKDSEEDENEDEFSWDSVEVEEDGEKETKEEDENWDEELVEKNDEEKSEVESNGELNWSAFSTELGLEAANKDEFLQELQRVMNSYSEQKIQSSAPSSTGEQINRYLGMSSRDLVAEELKMDGIDESEIEEQLDKMDENGLLKREAARIKRQLKNALTQEKTNTKHRAEEESKQRSTQVKTARDSLQKHFKGMNEFMGGKVTKSMAQRAYKFAINDLQEKLWSSHDMVADVSLFMLYKDKIKKILRTQGMEDGKASILNKITQPNLGTKGKTNYKPKSKEFDPSAFVG